jgi:hypothetical protein
MTARIAELKAALAEARAENERLTKELAIANRIVLRVLPDAVKAMQSDLEALGVTNG